MIAAAAPLVLSLLAGGPAPSAIRWERHFAEAMKKARATGKPVMVDFWAEWCGWCHRLDRTTYADRTVGALVSEGFIAVKVNTEGTPNEVALALRYDVSSLPTIAFLSPEGRMLVRLNGFQGPGHFPRTLRSARQVADKVLAWETVLQKDPSDAPALAALGVHMYEQDAYEESRDLLLRAVRLDAARPVCERKKSRLLLGMIQNFDRKYDPALAVLRDALDMKPPCDHDAKLLYVLGRTYLAAGREDDTRAAMTRLLKTHPDSPMASKARDTLHSLDRRSPHR